MGAFAAWPLLLTLTAAPDRAAVEPGGPRPGGDLGAEDARYLDWLVDEFLFDPKNAVYVRAPVPSEPVALSLRHLRPGVSENDGRNGWFVRGTNGDPDRVYFADGESVVVPAGQTRQLDFAALCADRYGQAAGRPVRPGSGVRESDLVLAAWLHRRGYHALAARALVAARDSRDDVREALRVDLAQRAASACVRAFADRDDTEAIAHAARLFALYPDLVANYAAQAAAVAADITRRHHAGLGSRQPPTGPPAGFGSWPVGDRIAFLVKSLDQVDSSSLGASPWDYFGRPRGDWRVAALEQLGDAAVPALIDAVEHDHRLTRWRENIHYLCCDGKGGRRPDRVLPVRELARDVLQTILRVRNVDPMASPEADDDAPGGEITRLRRYWARYGPLAFPDRMMAILTDPAAQPLSRREAATCLVDWSTEAGSSWARGPRPPAGSSPLVGRYARPTVAEAILAAMDRERSAGTDERAEWRDRIEEEYLRVLADLGDVRVASELARRSAAAPTAGSRLRLARAAHALGVAGPLAAFCREVTTGTLRFPLPPDRDAATAAVRDLVNELIDCQTPEADSALNFLADPGHPYFPVVARRVLGDADERGQDRGWVRHPYCVAVLRHLLTDRRPTGGHAYRRGDEIEERGRGKPRWWTPPGGADPNRWGEHVERTVGDDAADRLADLVVGLPEYHPLRRDADRVRAETRELLGKYAGRFRPLTWSEQQRLEMWRYGEAAFGPDVRPLGRPATAADVAAGRAVFQFNGASKLAEVKLPCWVVLKGRTTEDGRPVCGLVFQAEVGPDGTVTYGAVFRHAIRAVKAAEVERVEAETRD
jgi:hypothetical protein